jgi:hypothetical protein
MEQSVHLRQGSHILFYFLFPFLSKLEGKIELAIVFVPLAFSSIASILSFSWDRPWLSSSHCRLQGTACLAYSLQLRQFTQLYYRFSTFNLWVDIYR